jgi:hypothetical protein
LSPPWSDGLRASEQIGNWPPDELAAVDRIEAEIVVHLAAYGQLDGMVRVGPDGRLEIDVAGSLVVRRVVQTPIGTPAVLDSCSSGRSAVW